MSAPARPRLRPGRVYRTAALRRWSANPPRLVKRLVAEGRLVPLAHGLYSAPEVGRFGPVPPSDAALMDAFLDGTPYVFTGPERWNALGLGTTALYAAPLVYNTKRSGTFEFGGRRFVLRRVAFPRRPSPEWYVIDLVEHAEQAGATRARLERSLARAVAEGRFEVARLRGEAHEYGTRATQALVDRAVSAGSAC